MTIKVMIAGVGGASLGTEVAKCLRLAGGYQVYGCDVATTAYGLYDEGYAGTFRVDRDDYEAAVLKACAASGARYLIAGGEEPMIRLARAADVFVAAGVRLLANSPEVVATCGDKAVTFRTLDVLGIPTPRTAALKDASAIASVGMPCIVKPATNSGGSVSVFFADSPEEAVFYGEFIRRSGGQPILQEYIGTEEGEYTVGVLSLPDQRVAGSIALRRAFDAKLSVSYRARGALISSGYSQGYIGDFPEICAQAEAIARAIGSCGPINVQGRVRGGVLIPFEINPRFSASTYLRALAGCNEIDMLIRFLETGIVPTRGPLRSGWYLRSLTEQFVADGQLK